MSCKSVLQENWNTTNKSELLSCGNPVIPVVWDKNRKRSDEGMEGY